MCRCFRPSLRFTCNGQDILLTIAHRVRCGRGEGLPEVLYVRSSCFSKLFKRASVGTSKQKSKWAICEEREFDARLKIQKSKKREVSLA